MIQTTPGVYFELVDRGRPAIGTLRTDIAGFMGYTERGPLSSLGWALHLRALLAGADAWVPVARLRERQGDWVGAAEAWSSVGNDQAAARAASVVARAN